MFKLDSLPQDDLFPLDISETFFGSLSPDNWEFLVSEVVQVSTRLPVETNNQVNQRLLLVKIVSVEAENNFRMIKSTVHIEGGSFSWGRSSIKILGLGDIFQYWDDNYMVT